MKFIKRLLMVALMLIMLTGCVPSEVTPKIVTFQKGSTFRLEIANCPKGSTSTIIADIDGLGPNGINFRGVDGFLHAGDEILREVDCGNGIETFALGKVISIDETNWSANVEVYDPAILK